MILNISPHKNVETSTFLFRYNKASHLTSLTAEWNPSLPSPFIGPSAVVISLTKQVRLRKGPTATQSK